MGIFRAQSFLKTCLAASIPSMSPNRLHQANAARASKVNLLPLPRQQVAALSLRYHLYLETLRAGLGARHTVDTLAVMLLYAGGLHDLGHGKLQHVDVDAAQGIINDAYSKGRTTGVWKVGEDGFRLLAAILCTHDRQLAKAPIASVRKVDANVLKVVPSWH